MTQKIEFEQQNGKISVVCVLGIMKHMIGKCAKTPPSGSVRVEDRLVIQCNAYSL